MVFVPDLGGEAVWCKSPSERVSTQSMTRGCWVTNGLKSSGVGVG